EAAVTAAAAAISAGVRDFAAGARYPARAGEIGGHLFVLEFERGVSEAELARFAETLDRDPMRRNLDYEAHRAGGYGLHAPQVIALHRGGFAEWMRRRGRLGSQNKVPRVIADPALFGDLHVFAEANRQSPRGSRFRTPPAHAPQAVTK